MPKHLWVEMRYTIIEPELAEDGTIHVYAREAAIDAGVDDVKMGCWFCFTPLTHETLNTNCPGAPHDV